MYIKQDQGVRCRSPGLGLDFLKSGDRQCVYPFSCRDQSFVGDYRGSILSNIAETSQEGLGGSQPEEISSKSILQGIWSFLPPPNFLICQNPEKNRVPNWVPPKKSPGHATPKLTRVGDSAIFWGWQVLDSVIFLGWPVWDSDFFFWILAHRHIWGWQERSDTLYVKQQNVDLPF